MKKRNKLNDEPDVRRIHIRYPGQPTSKTIKLLLTTILRDNFMGWLLIFKKPHLFFNFTTDIILIICHQNRSTWFGSFINSVDSERASDIHWRKTTNVDMPAGVRYDDEDCDACVIYMTIIHKSPLINPNWSWTLLHSVVWLRPTQSIEPAANHRQRDMSLTSRSERLVWRLETANGAERKTRQRKKTSKKETALIRNEVLE